LPITWPNHTERERDTVRCIVSQRGESSQERQKIPDKLEISTDPIDPMDHPDEIVNTVTDRIDPATVNVDRSVEIGKAQLVLFEKNWPAGFHTPIPKHIVTLEITKSLFELVTKTSMT